MIGRRWLVPVLSLALAGLLAGCAEPVDIEEVEEQVAQDFQSYAWQAPASVSCPDELVAKVDSSVRCTITTADGGQTGATVTVTQVSRPIISYEIVFDPR